MRLLNRFPKPQEIIPVYAVGVTILYTFAIITSMNDFSRNWLLYLDIVEIFNLFTYIIAGAFVESLLVIIILIFTSLAFPPKIQTDRFVLYGTILTITFLFGLMLRDGTYVGIGDILSSTRMIFMFFALTAFTFSILSERFKTIRSIIESIADRCVIFLYVYMPLSLISVIAILIKNTDL